jgi:hypothetical protein
MKKLLLAMSLLLLGTGLVIFLCDLDTFLQYGIHSNEVASITEEGYIIAWPTGEVPWFAQITIRAYVLLFWVSAAGVYSLRFGVGRRYHGRMCRGAE